jgi:hypothetical protein
VVATCQETRRPKEYRSVEQRLSLLCDRSQQGRPELEALQRALTPAGWTLYDERLTRGWASPCRLHVTVGHSVSSSMKGMTDAVVMRLMQSNLINCLVTYSTEQKLAGVRFIYPMRCYRWVI